MIREVVAGYLASIIVSSLILWWECRVAILYVPGGDRE